METFYSITVKWSSWLLSTGSWSHIFKEGQLPEWSNIGAPLKVGLTHKHECKRFFTVKRPSLLNQIVIYNKKVLYRQETLTDGEG